MSIIVEKKHKTEPNASFASFHLPRNEGQIKLHNGGFIEPGETVRVNRTNRTGLGYPFAIFKARSAVDLTSFITTPSGYVSANDFAKLTPGASMKKPGAPSDDMTCSYMP